MNNFKRRIMAVFVMAVCGFSMMSAQNPHDAFDIFHNKVNGRFDSYSSMIEGKSSDYIRKIWEKYEAYAPLSAPDDDFKPVEFNEESPVIDIRIEKDELSEVNDTEEDLISEVIVPKEDIDEKPIGHFIEVWFYGIKLHVSHPECRFSLRDLSNEEIASAWDSIDASDVKRTLQDCLLLRRKHSLCDWAYLTLLESIASAVYPDNADNSVLLTAYLFGHSGYGFRLGRNSERLYLLFECNEEIYDSVYYVINGRRYYPTSQKDGLSGLELCDEIMSPRNSLSLLLTREQNYEADKIRNVIHLNSGALLEVDANPHILEFYSTYPTFRVGGNDMTRWAMYAQTPLDRTTRETVYPQIQNMICGMSMQDAANALLNFVQTGFVYKHDDELWGRDRVFFAEETLMNKYCDCDDRSVLFSHLVRDLLGLDVVLVYSPEHLFTAVNFPGDVQGSSLTVGDERFVICEPTCTSGAPIGWSGIKGESGIFKYILLDKIAYEKDYVVDFHGNKEYVKSLFPICENGKYGYRNTVGEIVVPCEYDRVSDYEQGDKFCYTAVKDGMMTLFHENGDICMSGVFDYIPFEQNMTEGGRYDCFGMIKYSPDGGWFFEDFITQVPSDYNYSDEYDMENINYDDNIYCAPLDGDSPFSDKFMILKKKTNGKYGIVSPTTSSGDPIVVIPCEYDSITFAEGDKSKVVLYDASTGKKEIRSLTK